MTRRRKSRSASGPTKKTPDGLVPAILRHLWYQWIRPLAPVVLIVLTFRGAVADWNDVPTPSMHPTIEVGDRILVNKLAFGLRIPLTQAWIAQWGGPERGDISVLISPKDGKQLVKRVVGLPGDEIAMRNNRLFINGQAVQYQPSTTMLTEQVSESVKLKQILATEQLGEHAHPVLSTPAIRAPRSFGPISVPAGHYFVMGDNRDRSADSRAFGFVPRNLLLGRSGRVALSFDPDNYYLPRLDRIWHKLP